MVVVRAPEIPAVVTYTLMGLTILVFLAQLANLTMFGSDLTALGVKANDAILGGQLWRFFTPMLLHGSIVHIAFNMYALYSFGRGLERQYGHWRFLALYLLGGFAGNVLSFTFTSADSLGASTSIFGLLGAEAVLLYQNRKLFGKIARRALGEIALIAGVNLMIGFSTTGIDNWGHIGGLVGGTLFAWFAGPLLKVGGLYPNLVLEDQRDTRSVLVAAMLVGAVFAALAAGIIIFRLQ